MRLMQRTSTFRSRRHSMLELAMNLALQIMARTEVSRTLQPGKQQMSLPSRFHRLQYGKRNVACLQQRTLLERPPGLENAQSISTHSSRTARANTESSGSMVTRRTGG